MSNQPLAGRVALVTGSARRIGRAIALELASRGAAVVVNARTDATGAERVAAEIAAAGGRALACLADVSDPADVARLIDTGVAHFGRLDILVNNAAIRRPVAFADMDYAEWRAIMAVVLDGAFLCCHAAAPHLGCGGHGRIVNIGGVTSHMGARGRAHVVAAKAGIVGLTKALAMDLGPDGITVNCLAPGLVEDAGDDAESTAFRRKHTPLEKIPLGRIGSPEDVARAVATLCGDDLAYLTGQTVHLNGGVFLW
jgi:3-oxoacyl-[acyl-carrier protein] reductase